MSSTSPSSPSSKAKRPGGGILQGPRPQPLIVSAPSAETGPSKRPRVSGGGDTGPVIVYELTPKVVHARPDEFMAVVQKLTGKQSTVPASVPPQPSASTVAPLLHQAAGGRSGTAAASATDPLVLALGQEHRPALPAIDGHPAVSLPPPSPANAAFLLSPTSLFLSPTTMQAIQELSALF
ncbi:hypothetical protein ABZP36_000410 [Zizania latifolia]